LLEIETTEEYDLWMSRLRDLRAKQHITSYFERQQLGSVITGDIKQVAPKVIEVRFHIGPGYRVYLTQEERRLVLLLVGGDKSTQRRDIEKAKELAKLWREERSHENKEV
jgi:putative addiction module killer protein